MRPLAPVIACPTRHSATTPTSPDAPERNRSVRQEKAPARCPHGVAATAIVLPRHLTFLLARAAVSRAPATGRMKHESSREGQREGIQERRPGGRRRSQDRCGTPRRPGGSHRSPSLDRLRERAPSAAASGDPDRRDSRAAPPAPPRRLPRGGQEAGMSAGLRAKRRKNRHRRRYAWKSGARLDSRPRGRAISPNPRTQHLFSGASPCKIAWPSQRDGVIPPTLTAHRVDPR